MKKIINTIRIIIANELMGFASLILYPDVEEKGTLLKLMKRHYESKEGSVMVVSTDPLREVLSACAGPEHLIRELQVMRGLPMKVANKDPISTLIEEFNSQASGDE